MSSQTPSAWVIRTTALTCGGITVTLAAARGLLFGPNSAGFLILFTAAVAFVGAGLLARDSTRHTAAVLIPAIAMVALSLLAWTDGSIASDAVYWLPFAPVVSALFIDRRAAWLTGAIGAGLILALMVRAHGFSPPPDALLRGPAIIGAIGFGVALVTVYDQERTRTAQQLLRREARLRELFDALPIGTVVVDADARILHQSNLRAALSHKDARHLEGTASEGDLSPEISSALRDCIARCRASMAPTVVSVTAHGRNIELRGVPFSEDEMVVALIDVTELQNAARMKDQFVATVSHELRTPLTASLAAIKLLADGDVAQAERRSLLEVAQRNGERLARLVEDLLDMQQLSTGSLRVQRHPVPLQDVVSQAIEELGPFSRSAEIELVHQHELDSEPVVMADPLRLHQVLVNVIENALKFSPAHSTVRIHTHALGRQARVQVIDEGPGIPDSVLPTIFEPFAQVDNAPDRENQGSGLGLAISRSLMETMGGTLECASTNGNGSIFTVALPLSG